MTETYFKEMLQAVVDAAIQYGRYEEQAITLGGHPGFDIVHHDAAMKLSDEMDTLTSQMNSYQLLHED